jgi:hypothetical protein
LSVDIQVTETTSDTVEPLWGDVMVTEGGVVSGSVGSSQVENNKTPTKRIRIDFRM